MATAKVVSVSSNTEHTRDTALYEQVAISLYATPLLPVFALTTTLLAWLAATTDTDSSQGNAYVELSKPDNAFTSTHEIDGFPPQIQTSVLTLEVTSTVVRFVFKVYNHSPVVMT